MSEQTLEELLASCKPEPVEIDHDNYMDASEFPPPIPEGIYTLKPTWQDPAVPFKVKDGFLMATLKQIVVAPGEASDGHGIGFDTVSTKPFERSGVKVSGAMDQLRAWGNTDRPKTAAQYAEAIKAAVDGSTLSKAFVNWELGCNHSGTPEECEWNDKNVYRLKGMKKFPLLPNGEHNSEVECPTCKQTVRARERIGRRLPAA